MRHLGTSRPIATTLFSLVVALVVSSQTVGALAPTPATASVPTERAAVKTDARAAGSQSALRLSGRLIAYVAWTPSSNTFQVSDAYPDNQSAAVRFQVGSVKRTLTRWNHGGSGTSANASIDAGGLKVRFKACRSSRSHVSYQCAKRWTTVASVCRKGSWQRADLVKGACVVASGEVIRGEVPIGGWAYRVRGLVNSPATHGKRGSLQVRTRRDLGDPWNSWKVVASSGAGRWSSYDEVVYNGGPRFYMQFRICGNGCGGPLGVGDVPVGW